MSASFMEQHGPALLKGGFTVLPIAPRQKAPMRWDGRQYQALNNWVERYRARQPDSIVKSWTMWPDCGVGIVCGSVVAVDLDIDDEELQDQAYAIVNRRLGVTPAVRIGRAPRRLLVYRTSQVFRKMSIGKRKGAQVEILADGQQFVAYGIHPEGHEYRWVGDQLSDLTLDDLPEISHQQFWDTLQELKGILPEADQALPAASTPGTAATGSTPQAGTLEAITSALEAIPNDDLPWDDWNNIGLALFGALGNAAWPLFEAWSARSAKNDPRQTAKRWEGYNRSPPTTAGAGKIYAIAMERGWSCPPGVTMNGEVARAEREAPIELGNYDPTRQPRATAPAAVPDDELVAGMIFNGEHPAQAIPYLVAGVVPRHGVGCIAGESTAGKTFCEVLLATCIASQEDFVGNVVKERCGAMIIAGEGFDTLNNRIIACQSMIAPHAGVLPIVHAKPLKRIQTSRDLAAEMPRVMAVLKIFKERFGARLGVIFFDTVAASLFVEDENDANDAQKCIELMGELADATGAVVIALHHYNKSGTIRGSSAFTAGFDFIITAERGDKEKEDEKRTLHLRKDRNGKERQLATYTIQSIGLGEDSEGEPFNAGFLSADPVILKGSKASKPDEEEKGPDLTVDTIIKTIAMAKVRGEKLFSNRDELVLATGISDWKVRRALEKMRKEKLLISKNDKYFLTPSGQKYFDEGVD